MTNPIRNQEKMHVAEIMVDTITDLKKTRIGQCLEACGPGQVTLEDEHQKYSETKLVVRIPQRA